MLNEFTGRKNFKITKLQVFCESYAHLLKGDGKGGMFPPSIRAQKPIDPSMVTPLPSTRTNYR